MVSMIKNKIRNLLSTGFFHIFGGNVLNKVISFMSGFVLVRILTKTEYGRFTHAWNIYGLLLIISGFGIESGALQLASERNNDDGYCRKVFNYGTRYGLKVNTVIAAVLMITGLFVNFRIKGTGPLIVMLCLLPFIQLLFSMSSVYLRAAKRNRDFSALMLINTTSVFIFSVILSFFFRERGLVAANYIAGIISLAVSYFFFKVRLIRRDDAPDDAEKNVLLRLSFISMLNSGLSQLLYLLDIFVLGIIDPDESIIASYKVATTLPTALVFIPTSLIVYIYPYFAEHRNDRKWCISHYKTMLLCFGAFNLFISAIMFIFAPFIVKTLFGAQYSDCVEVFRVLAVNYFFAGTFRIISGNLLVTQRKLRFNLITAIVSSACNIVADFFFIQWWGSMGAAFATVLVVLISSAMSTIYLIHVFKHIPEKTAEETTVTTP